MKGYKERQNYLKNIWKFDCYCDLCQREENDNNDSDYVKYGQIEQECQKIEANVSDMVYPESYIKLCHLYKQLYQLAKNKNCPRTFIVQKILRGGFQAAFSGYLHASFSEEKKYLKDMDIFRKECDLFSGTAVKISEIALPDPEVWLWRQRKDNLDLCIEQYISKKMSHFQTNLT